MIVHLPPPHEWRRAQARAGVAAIAEGTEVVRTAYHYVRMVVPSGGPPRLTVTEVRGSSESPLDAFDLAPPPGNP